MKILFVNQFFYPDHSAVSQILTDLAEDLVAARSDPTGAGDQVEVICGRGGYSGGRTLQSYEKYHGIDIHRVPSTGFGRRTMLGRISDMLAFYVTATWAMLRRRSPARSPDSAADSPATPPDVLCVLSTPPLLCLCGLLVGKLRGLPVVYVIQDLYPDIAVALGVLKPDSWITRLVNGLSVFAMRRVDRIIALGRYAKELIVAKGIPERQIVVLENWADPQLTRPVPRDDNWFRRERNLGDKFVVLYSGNMGLAYEYRTILESARRLRHRSDIVFLFIGDGARRREIEQYREEHGLTNLRLEGYQDRSDLSYSLSSGDAFLVSLRPGAEGLVLPCKVYAGMAVARPLLFVGSQENDTAETIRRAGCGWIFAPGDVDGLTAKILELQEHPELAAERGQRGREALERSNYRGHATEGYRRVFLEALHPSHRSL
jgi:glycosyltransferase involved in cell wall biosynthesis